MKADLGVATGAATVAVNLCNAARKAGNCAQAGSQHNHPSLCQITLSLRNDPEILYDRRACLRTYVQQRRKKIINHRLKSYIARTRPLAAFACVAYAGSRSRNK